MDIKDLAQIIGILKSNEVTEFELEQQDGTKIKLSRGLQLQVGQGHVGPYSASTPILQPAILPSSQVSSPGVSANGVTGAGTEVPSHLLKVESPIVGTFYRKSSPDAEPFAKEGQSVKKGDTLCIVEAMKLMNEIESPNSGRIEKILVQDGSVVEFGEVLFLINPNA